MKELICSNNEELATMPSEIRTDCNGYVIESHVDSDYPEIGYAGSINEFRGGDLWQYRLLFFHDKHETYVIGQEVTLYPWSFIKPVKMHLQLDVPESLNFGSDFHGKTVEIGPLRDEQNVVSFDSMDDLLEFYKRHIQEFRNLPHHKYIA